MLILTLLHQEFLSDWSHFISKKVGYNELIILATALLTENSLLVSRYTRFQHLNPKSAQLFEAIRTRQKRLGEEYLDTTERCERLIKIYFERLKDIKNSDLAGNRKEDSGFHFDVADLALYLRWFIVHNHSQKDLNTFFSRMKVLFFSFENRLFLITAVIPLFVIII